VDEGDCEVDPLGHDRSNVGGSVWREAVTCFVAVGRPGDGGSVRLLAGALVGAAAGVEAGAAEASLAADGGVAAGLIEASVSCTGFGFGTTEAAAASGAAMLVTFCLVARYPPTPAAPIQAAASAAKARRFKPMENLSPYGNRHIVTQGAYPRALTSLLCK
jgi:hypothetical protein